MARVFLNIKGLGMYTGQFMEVPGDKKLNIHLLFLSTL